MEQQQRRREGGEREKPFALDGVSDLWQRNEASRVEAGGRSVGTGVCVCVCVLITLTTHRPSPSHPLLLCSTDCCCLACVCVCRKRNGAFDRPRSPLSLSVVNLENVIIPRTHTNTQPPSDVSLECLSLHNGNGDVTTPTDRSTSSLAAAASPLLKRPSILSLSSPTDSIPLKNSSGDFFFFFFSFYVLYKKVGARAL